MVIKAKTKRYTLDMNREQLRFLKLFAHQHDFYASTVVRALIYLLETDAEVQYAVIDEIYPVDREPLALIVEISGKDRNVSRYTLDLHYEQSNYLGFITINQGIKASVILRAMIYLLETNVDLGECTLQELVMDLLSDIDRSETEDEETEPEVGGENEE